MKAIKIISVIGVLLLFIMTVSALEPLPVNGRLIGVNVENQEVQIKNLRTGVIETERTSSGGEFLNDWMNSDTLGGTVMRFQSGDTFEVKITGCSAVSSACVQTGVFYGLIEPYNQPELFFTFDLTGVQLQCPTVPSCPSCGSCSGGSSGGGTVIMCTEAQCRDKYPYEAEDPNCEETVCSTISEAQCRADYPCSPDDPDCGECKTCETCPEQSDPVDDGGRIALEILGAIMLAAGAAWGGKYFSKNNMKVYPKCYVKIWHDINGNPRVAHMHPGLRGYHDPKTSHSELHERHPKGMVHVKYVKDPIKNRYEFRSGE